MKDLKSIVTLSVILVVVLLATLALVSNRGSSTPSQTASVEENLDSDLNSLDATDLDTGFNSQLDQLSSDSSSF